MSPTTTATQPHLLTPVRRPTSPLRSRRMPWLVIVGVVLLVCSIVGASIVINQGLLPETPAKKTGEPHVLGVAAQGLVDADPKVADLNPTQQGRIVWLIDEGKQAKKGDVLLKIDDRHAKNKVDQAKAALEGALATLDMAE